MWYFSSRRCPLPIALGNGYTDSGGAGLEKVRHLEQVTRIEVPFIDSALVIPGHDGAAELVVQVRYGNGARDSVTLDAEGARRLFERCGADSVADLAGMPWDHLMHVLAP
jgi:hypothetical protein